MHQFKVITRYANKPKLVTAENARQALCLCKDSNIIWESCNDFTGKMHLQNGDILECSIFKPRRGNKSRG